MLQSFPALADFLSARYRSVRHLTDFEIYERQVYSP
jgi:hypothetical protein